MHGETIKPISLLLLLQDASVFSQFDIEIAVNTRYIS